MTSLRGIRDYKDLEIWRRAMGLAEAIYSLSRKLPSEEQFGLISQLRRSAVSVPCNIAEGYGRQATGEYRHHLSMARGSLLELETQLLLCLRLRYLDSSATSAVEDELRQIVRMLSALITKLRH